jgi:hypothetical protein
MKQQKLDEGYTSEYWARLFAPDCPDFLMRRIEQQLVAHDVLYGGWRPAQIAKEIIDRFDDEQVRAFAIQRIQHAVVYEVLVKPEVCKRLFHEKEELLKRRSSVDRLVQEMGG